MVCNLELAASKYSNVRKLLTKVKIVEIDDKRTYHVCTKIDQNLSQSEIQ